MVHSALLSLGYCSTGVSVLAANGALKTCALQLVDEWQNRDRNTVALRLLISQILVSPGGWAHLQQAGLTRVLVHEFETLIENSAASAFLNNLSVAFDNDPVSDLQHLLCCDQALASGSELLELLQAIAEIADSEEKRKAVLNFQDTHPIHLLGKPSLVNPNTLNSPFN